MSLTVLALSLSLSAAAPAAPAFGAEDFRIFCGYEQEAAKEENKALADDKKLAKIAKLAKVNPKQLKEIVGRASKLANGTCEGIAKDYEAKARAALAGTPVDARILSFQLDVEDPTHVVAYVSWKGDQEKRLEEEASLVAWAITSAAPIVRTTSTRATDPKDADVAMFEGKISADQATKIEKDRIDSFADARYLKLFDGVVFANPAAHPSAKR